MLPRLFGTIRALLEDCYSSPALLAARSRGLGPIVIAGRYVLLATAPQLIALLGIALGPGLFGLAIPIEALCQTSRGSARSRCRLPRLAICCCCAALALIITFFVTFVHAVGDLATDLAGEHA